jgi:dihydroorotase
MRLHNVSILRADGLSRPMTVDLPIAEDVDRDASGLIVSPGFVDLHAHLRDPGFPDKETLASGTASAAFGGFTSVLAMANTNPVTDTPAIVREQIQRASGLPIRVLFAGAITTNLEGGELTDAMALKHAGAVALSDDGRHAVDGATLREGLRRAREAELPLFIHAQKEELGRAVDAEVSAIGEAIEALSDVPGARLHIQHVSTALGAALVGEAKRDGLALTAEVTPHHLALTEDDGVVMGPQGNVSPPLRTALDREAVKAALIEGVIDVIATDHAPHERVAKAAGATGFHGFETALGVLLSLGLDWPLLYRACVQRPKEILHPLPEDVEDWIVIDPALEWTVEPSSFRSKGKNTPFAGRRFRGRVVMTVCDGQLVFERMVQRV